MRGASWGGSSINFRHRRRTRGALWGGGQIIIFGTMMNASWAVVDAVRRHYDMEETATTAPPKIEVVGDRFGEGRVRGPRRF